METLSTLRRQLDSAQELQSVVKSMKAMAAASIWHYQQVVETMADYRQTVEWGLQIVLGTRSEPIQLAQPERVGRVGAVIFGSEQGMVGSFNDEIVDYARRRMEAMNAPVDRRSLVAVGGRVRHKLERARQPVALGLQMPTSVTGIRPAMQQLMVRVEDWRTHAAIEWIVLFYNAPSGGTRYEARGEQLMPLNLGWLRRLQQKAWSTNSLPAFDQPEGKLFADLIREYLYIVVFEAFAASLAAENASRLSSMEAAESNIEERLDELRRQYHQVRQRSITSELLDIVSGAEAAAGAATDSEA